jgi:hypothetical protein
MNCFDFLMFILSISNFLISYFLITPYLFFRLILKNIKIGPKFGILSLHFHFLALEIGWVDRVGVETPIMRNPHGWRSM